MTVPPVKEYALAPVSNAPLSPAEVRELIGGGLAYTTVVTILSRLHAKGLLSRQKAGRVYRYAPVADQPGLAARRMTRVLDEEADRDRMRAPGREKRFSAGDYVRQRARAFL